MIEREESGRNPASPDEALVEGLKEGRLSSFQQFYEEYSPFLYQISLKMLHDPMEAEDLTHDLFIEVMERIHQYDPERGSFQAWLAVLSRSRSLDRLRKKKPLLVEDIGELYRSQASAERTEEKAIRRLEQEMAEEAIHRLPDLQRQAIERFYFGSKTHQELAEELGRPLGTIKSLLRYGLKNVRKQLSQVGWLEVTSGEPKR
ncbi:RNA polymerase, sigma-24 subunit, ECF subfamily [[Clostridium] ultunense Esp]|nr:RNA polymerase, sigma-24 subunit, ECF subfamily [[Clostridium] ultunense Esp]